jgi:hypothetical protein
VGVGDCSGGPIVGQMRLSHLRVEVSFEAAWIVLEILRNERNIETPARAKVDSVPCSLGERTVIHASTTRSWTQD